MSVRKSGGAAADQGGGSVPPEAIKAIPIRHYGRWVSGVVVLGLLGLIGVAFSNAQINWSIIPDYVFAERFVEGAGKTLGLTVLSMVIGVVLGIVLAIMRMSKNPVTSAVANGYIWIFRGTPVLLQLLLWYNLALIFPIINLGFYRDEMTDFMTPFMAALLGLALNEAAYMAEIVRAGIQSVDEGQTEASQALGMSRARTLRRIILPQAMRVIIPPTGNEFINMLKTSSLAYVITFGEVTRVAIDVSSSSLAVMEMLFVAAIWYLIMTTVFSIVQFYIERHYAKGSLRQLPPTPLQKVRAQLLSLRAPNQVGGTGA
ncbi:amino acid ABC transporter permease [Streptomyces sp. 549]|uniref:amino acid ABC transporter permease n=1 Tax=Streptomyces sp. 549 TaxID=3049076 RepID=UPI0024C370C2|nr:amino acid ABC transporter permease [Streptomyces sp. 549]MDK1476490.1 amino acid ABC transporter permease [Streptomyces sp. 549]